MKPDALPMWTVYQRPSDLPEHAFVARCHRVVPGGKTEVDDDYLAADSLEALRWLLPRGLTRLARSPEDDPVIVEVWI